MGDSAVSGRTADVLQMMILGLICMMAFMIRLFAVVRYESVIHEFDPYFNYRTTDFLVREGPDAFRNWFDNKTWYPLGRVIGGTLYPALMLTSGYFHHLLQLMTLPVNVRNICVFLAPVFSANTAVATYFFTGQVVEERGAKLFAAAFVAIVPSYISRSCGGSYDNEGVAIFALIFTFYLYLKGLNTGRVTWAVACSVSYFYMVAAWGGYVFITNLIPIHAVFLLLAGRFSYRLYITYSIFYAFGQVMAMQVPFVGFNAVLTSEHLAAHGAFAIIQIFALWHMLLQYISAKDMGLLVKYILSIVGMAAVGVLAFLTISGKTQWAGRSLTLLDPTYASKYIPIIASVSEHQPPTWSSYFMDIHMMQMLLPVGMYACFHGDPSARHPVGGLDREKAAVLAPGEFPPSDAKIFALFFACFALYFSGVMIRLMLVLAPIACVMGGIAMSAALQRFSARLKSFVNNHDEDLPIMQSIAFLVTIVVLLAFYSYHAVWVSDVAYSSPSIVLAQYTKDGRVLYDDYREAYMWLRRNTATDARVMSWWDYGYQLGMMANRTTLVDNNTWNNTHIATVGRAMASSEASAYRIMRQLDVDYVLVIFGGVVGFSSDDINKFLWMVRIGSGVYPDYVQEKDYLTDKGDFKVDDTASNKMLNCLLYRLTYYRYDELTLLQPENFEDKGYDNTRKSVIGKMGFDIHHLEEAFTSQNWMVRIYKVKPLPNRRSSHVASARYQRRAAARRDKFLLGPLKMDGVSRVNATSGDQNAEKQKM